jgi:tRNA(Ile)-lysidine synthase
MLSDNVLQTIRRHRLIPPGSLLLVAVSGGADSLALLHILHSQQVKLRIQLHVATLDHGLRGTQGAEDAVYVQALAETWSLPVTVGTAALDPDAPSIEARARTARYQFLAETAAQIGATHVAVAHHADDQAETVLMRLLRGSGLRGLSAMPYESDYPGEPSLRLIRPLLDVTRAQIEAYCAEHDLKPRLDTTNTDTAHLRNRLRLDILPRLQEINPQVQAALKRLAEISAQDHDFIEGVLGNWTAQYVTHQRGYATIERSAFEALHPALQRRAVLRVVERVHPDAEPTYEHVVDAVQIGLTGQVGAVSVLPTGLRLRVDYHALVIERGDRDIFDDDALPEAYRLLLPPGSEIAVSLPGLTSTPLAWKLETLLTMPPDFYRARLSIAPESRVTLRTRRPGDVFTPVGLHGHRQKVKKWMIDQKIPQRLRDSIPILTVDEKIAALLIGVKWIISFEFIQDVNSVYLRENTSM